MAVALTLFALLAATCFTVLGSANVNAQAAQGAPDSIKLLTFYEKGCCKSCADIDTYIGETLNTYYPDLVSSGKISAQYFDLKKDQAMADKYGAKNWALKMVVTRNGQETVVDVPEIWMYTGNRDASISCLKTAIDKQLGK
ncbi:MAG: hypothetical protein WBZ29_14200 [Methanocella sp.]